MKRFGIHIRLFLAAILLIMATTVTLGYMGLSITRQFALSRFESRMNFLARNLALNAELGILIGQKDTLENLAQNLLSENDVVKVSIEDNKEDILAEAAKPAPRAKADEIYEVEVPVKLSRMKSFPWGLEIDAKAHIIGKVKIAYSLEGIHRLLWTMTSRFVLFSVGLACLSVVIFYFLSRSIVAPVTRLGLAARQVAEGNLELRVQPDNLPETREVGLAFNSMLDFIETSQGALKRANEEIIRQQTLAELGKFSLMVAHEVKNPLGIIKSSLDILKQDVQLKKDYIPIVYIEDEIRRLNQLIEEFLLFARPAAPAFRSVDLNRLLREIIDRFEVQLNRSSLRILADIPDASCRMDVDPDLLTRAVGNVLKNAVEANGRQGTIDVRACQEEGNWKVEIQDQGSGIEPGIEEKIFEPFFTTRSKGTGLGLAFVFQAIAAHGGEVRAENRPEGGGARFTIELPLNGNHSLFESAGKP
ncbi:MAG: ATP-binding protein [Desulfatiglandales bacterium]